MYTYDSTAIWFTICNTSRSPQYFPISSSAHSIRRYTEHFQQWFSKALQIRYSAIWRHLMFDSVFARAVYIVWALLFVFVGHVIVITGIPYGNPKGWFQIKFTEAASKRQALHISTRFEPQFAVVRTSMNENFEYVLLHIYTVLWSNFPTIALI